MFHLELTFEELTVLSCVLAGEELLPSQTPMLLSLDAQVTALYQTKEAQDACPDT